MTTSRLVFGAVILAFCLVAADVPLPAQNPTDNDVAGGYFLPPRAIKRFGTNRLRHGSRIQCLAYSPDGQVLASAGGQDPIRLWDTETGRAIASCNEPWAQAIVFHPRGRTLVSAGAFKAVRLWDAPTGKEIAKLEGHTAGVKALAMAGNGLLVASGSVDGMIHLWDVQARKSVVQYRHHADEINALALSADNSLLASASSDRTVQVVSTDTNKNNTPLHKFDGGCCVLAVVFGPEGTLYSAGDDGLIRQWDLNTGKEIGVRKGHEGTIVSLTYNLSDKTLISGGRDGSIRFWKDGEAMASKVIPRDLGDCDALAVAADLSHVATAGTNNTIRIFDAQTGKEALNAPGPQAPLVGLASTSDGATLVTLTSTGKVFPWNTGNGRLGQPWSATSQPTELAFAVSPDNKTLATVGPEIVLWNLADGKERFKLPRPDGDVALAVRFSPDGKTLAVGLRGKQLELWDLEEKKVIHQLKSDAPVYAVAFSTDGAIIALSGGSKIALFETATAKPLRDFPSKEGPPAAQPLVATLVFSPDSKTLAAGCYDGAIRLYDFASGKEVSACEGHSSVPYCLAFSRDGRLLASGSFDRTVRLWEAFSSKSLATLSGHTGAVMGVAFSPDDRTLYSASTDTNILAWDVTGSGDPATPRSAGMGPAELEMAWKELASDDAPTAHRTLWRVVLAHKDALPYLGKKVYLVDPGHVRQLFKDLDSDNYGIRTAAMKQIEDYGRWMEPRLKTYLEEPPSLEAKRRGEQLLEKLNIPGSLTGDQEQLRLRRMMLVLEHVGDDACVKLLQDLSKRGPLDPLMIEAQASVDRIGRRTRQ